MLVLDAVLTGAKGDEHLVQLPRHAAAAPGPALYRPGRAWPRVVRIRCAAARRPQPFLYTLSLTAMEGVAAADARDSATLRRRSSALREHGVTEEEVDAREAPAPRRLVFENDSVTNIAHQLGYFETVTGPGVLTESLAGRIDASDRRRGVARRPAAARPIEVHRRLVQARREPRP